MLFLSATACGDARDARDVRERAYQANNRGVALLEQFNYPDAAAAFRQALQIDDSIAIARLNLALALLYAQDLQGAAAEASTAARLLPSAPQPPYVLGLIARAENRPADALRDLERVRQIDPADVGTNINIGQIHLEERRYADAAAVLREAVSAEPFNVTAAYNLGLALTRGGQADEGRAILARAQTLRTVGYAVTYGTGYLEQGRYAEAVASTGAEPALVDEAVPPVTFTSAPIGSGNAAAAVPLPFGRRYTAADLTASGAQALAAGLGGGATLLDLEPDGDLDLFTASAAGESLFVNDGRAGWTDASSGSGLGPAPENSTAIGAVAGDYDNDGRTDLFVLRYGVSSLYHNDGSGRFSDAAARAGIPPYAFLPGAAAFADVDHDGDLDLIVAGLADVAGTRSRAGDRALAFPQEFAPAPLLLLRNNGDGTFTESTAAAGLQTATRAIAIVPTDYDNRRDLDLLVVNAGRPPALFQNLRDGRFRDVAADVGLAALVGPDTGISAATAADLNKDDFPDFFFARSGGGVFALSDGRGRFVAAPAPDGADGAVAAQLFDYDNDGLIDLLTWAADGPRLFRNLGGRWADVTARAIGERAAGAPRPTAPRGLALGDLNADATTDLVTTGSGPIAVWRNNGDPARHAQRVVVRGRVSNRSGVGAKVQLRAGSLSARVETSAATPAVAPSDIVFGLGSRPAADVVRVLWPSGVLQAEPLAASPAVPASPALPVLAIDELDRKPSSCPFLFTWNGERFEFVTDFLGGGEIGYWDGPGRRNAPDPVEYVRIRGDQLRPRDGRLEIRVTNELEEAVFADRLQLLALAHPRGVEVYPNEGMTAPPKPFRVLAVSDERVPRATDEHGHDVTDRIARIDRRYPDDFAVERIRGYARPHTLTLDLSNRQGLVGRPFQGRANAVLLLTAWTDYAFSSDNLAAHQAGLSLSPPSLQIKDGAGRWRTAIEQIGIPVGRPQTFPVDLSAYLRPGEHAVRIVTNMRIYWDRIVVGRAASNGDAAPVPLDPVAAILRSRGFSAEVRPDGVDPPVYDYADVTQASPWKVMAGRYTREGDVRELLVRSDDMFVIAKPGDEMALEFEAALLPPIPEGWTRTFLLRADGYSKEMDINSATPDAVEPLPFHRMTRYPYSSPERYPDTPEHQRYQSTYNTRVVVKTIPSIDLHRR